MSIQAKVFKSKSNLSLLLREKGITTLAELARRCEMIDESINGAVNGDPRCIFGAEPGTYRRPARRIAEVLGVPPEVIFGENPKDDERRKEAESQFAQDNFRVPLDPETAAFFSTLRDTTTRVIASLTPREERVLRQRFGIGMKSDDGPTLEDVGAMFSVSRERIRQIEAKSLRKLKHPSSSRKLLSFLEDKPKERDELKGFEPKS